MAKINQKLTTIYKALASLQESIELLHEYSLKIAGKHTEHDARIALGLRDSTIQRFEYCTDLFWKVLKIYLEDIEKITLTANSPAGTLRAAVETRIITEEQGRQCIEMVKSRNETSHIYHDETAQNIAAKIPGYYELIKTIVDSLNDRLLQTKS